MSHKSEQLTGAKMSPGNNSDNDIQIRVIEAKDHDRVLDFLRIHYYREEPLTAGSEPKQQDAADEEFNMSNIKHGTCLMAVDTLEENIVGAVMAGPKTAEEADHLFEEAAHIGTTKWGNILQFLACIERDANVCSRYEVTKALHAHVLGVDTRIRGRAIGGRLMQQLMVLGRELGYPLLVADCTSVYSARLCHRLGMECINTMRYADYTDKEGKQVFCPPLPHESVETYAIRL